MKIEQRNWLELRKTVNTGPFLECMFCPIQNTRDSALDKKTGKKVTPLDDLKEIDVVLLGLGKFQDHSVLLLG